MSAYCMDRVSFKIDRVSIGYIDFPPQNKNKATLNTG